jgi:hypothetical protein
MTDLIGGCDNSGWVCEEHPECPWELASGDTHCKGVPGMPCACNPNGEIDQIMTTLYDTTGDKRH